MKSKTIKRIISSTVSAMMIASCLPMATSVIAADEMGGFDMSQFGGGFGGGMDMGGFDMSQFGGGQGGFDMSQFGGGQGGFDMSQFGGGMDMGGFDMSQFGGGMDMGGFDMSQFGGGQGGFDMSQFGGGMDMGGFDMSQFGGGQGGFDMSQFGGGQGGFDMSQFGGGFGGGGQGGFDMSGFAGGFAGGGGNIGSDPGSGGNATKGLNAKIKSDMPTIVPDGVEKSSGCKVEHKTYNCKFTGGTKGCNVVLPPNYDPSKKYPVMYVLHGIGGDEGSMKTGMGVQELLTGLISSGKAEEMIIVLPSQYTSKTGSQGGGFAINQEVCAAYDNFLYDIADSLIPFIEENYPVKTGRENRAITGFSMGGREAIYIGLMRPDLFAYVGGACPAPGITPGSDMFMTHPGCMQPSEMKFRDVGPEPEVFMITGGTNDSVVGTFPQEYSDILTTNGVEHVYQSIPGGGHGAESVKPHLYTFMRYAFKSNEGGGTTPTPVVTTTTTTTAPVVTTTVTTTAPIVITSDPGFGGQGGFDMGQFGGGTVDPGSVTPGKLTKEAINARVSKWGDANGDGVLELADAIFVMQSLANPNKYVLSQQGKDNADVVDAGGGITSSDALAIQKYLLGTLSALPESYMDGIS